MPATALSARGCARGRSGPDGETLAAGAWQPLEALPDPGPRRGGSNRWPAWSRSRAPRSPPPGTTVHRGRAMDQAGWPGGPGPACAPWDPLARRYRAPDEKTIRVVLVRLDPAPWPGPCSPAPASRRRRGGPPPASVRGYHARRAAGQAKALARGRLRAVAVDGETSRAAGPRWPPGARRCPVELSPAQVRGWRRCSMPAQRPGAGGPVLDAGPDRGAGAAPVQGGIHAGRAGCAAAPARVERAGPGPAGGRAGRGGDRAVEEETWPVVKGRRHGAPRSVFEDGQARA